MDYLLATKLRYYAEDNSDIIINKVLEKTSHRITSCRHELICILNDILDTEGFYIGHQRSPQPLMLIVRIRQVSFNGFQYRHVAYITGSSYG